MLRSPVVLAALLLSACTPGVSVSPEEGVATDLTITAHSDGWGTLLSTEGMDTEGDLLCDWPEDEPYNDPPNYYVYASADGFFTEVYLCTQGDTIGVDLDAVGDRPDAVAGSIFATQSFFAPAVVADHRVGLSPGGATTTDEQGRYHVSELKQGDIELSLRWEMERFALTVDNGAGVDYADWRFPAPMQAAKPNIYLWPQETTEVSVTLGFPRGGHLDVSDPPYDGGWTVTATPDGWLDGSHGFLFYEATVPPELQLSHGWVIGGDQIESELRGLLGEAGFIGREIDDFVDWWVPRLEPAPYYAVYPQQADAWVTVQVEPEPDTVLRALWLIHPMPVARDLLDPVVEPVSRDGFTVTEWGVILP